MGICDDHIFKSVYLAWCKPLQKFVISKGLNADDAIDVVQDAFVRLWKNCDQVVTESVKPYLFTIARNLVIDQYRKQKDIFIVKEDGVIRSTAEDGQYQLEMEEFRLKFESVIAEMPQGQREVFLMHRMSEMSYKDIAEALNLSVKAIEKRMQKALIFLHDKNILKKK